MLVLIPRCCVGLHQYGTTRKIPSGEKVCDSLGDFLNGRFVGILLDKGMSVHNLFGYAAGQLLRINRFLPICVAKNLAFGEKNYIILKGV